MPKTSLWLEFSSFEKQFVDKERPKNNFFTTPQEKAYMELPEIRELVKQELRELARRESDPQDGGVSLRGRHFMGRRSEFVIADLDEQSIRDDEADETPDVLPFNRQETSRRRAA